MSFGINANLGGFNALSLYDSKSKENTNPLKETALEKLSSKIRVNGLDKKSNGVEPDTSKTQTPDFSKAIENATEAVGALTLADQAIVSQQKLAEAIRVKANLAGQDGLSVSQIGTLRDSISGMIKEFDKLAASFAQNGFTTNDNKRLSVNGSVYTSVNDVLASSNANNIGYANIEAQKQLTDSSGISLQIVNSNGSTTDLSPSVIAATSGSGLNQLANAVNSTTAQTGVTATYNNTSTSIDQIQSGNLYDLAINGVMIGDIANIQSGDSDGKLVSAINAYSSATGVSASTDDSGRLVLNATNSEINVSSGQGSTSTPQTYYSVSQINEFGVATKYVNLNTSEEVVASQIDANSQYVNRFYKTESGAYRDGIDGGFAGFEDPTSGTNPYTASFSVHYDPDDGSDNNQDDRDRQDDNGRRNRRRGNRERDDDRFDDNRGRNDDNRFDRDNYNNNRNRFDDRDGRNDDNRGRNNNGNGNNSNSGNHLGWWSWGGGAASHGGGKPNDSVDTNPTASSYLDQSNGGNALSLQQIAEILASQGGQSDGNTLNLSQNSFTSDGALDIQAPKGTKVVASSTNGESIVASSYTYTLGNISEILNDFYLAGNFEDGAKIAESIASEAVTTLGRTSKDLNDNIQVLKNTVANLYDMQENLPRPSNTLIPEPDFKKDSESFDKTKVLGRSGSFLQAQSLITQDSVARLLFPDFNMGMTNQVQNASKAKSANPDWSLSA